MTLHLPQIVRYVAGEPIAISPEHATSDKLDALAVDLREQQSAAWETFENEIRRVDRVRYAQVAS